VSIAAGRRTKRASVEGQYPLYPRNCGVECRRGTPPIGVAGDSEHKGDPGIVAG
jgi:hypothetical protein